MPQEPDCLHNPKGVCSHTGEQGVDTLTLILLWFEAIFRAGRKAGGKGEIQPEVFALCQREQCKYFSF